jgi:outer membrane protein assembly factor BamB
MKIHRSQIVILALALALLPATASAAETWSQFRGPTQQGHADGKVPLTWSETEHVKWKTALPGQGWSSPVIGDGRIWMTTALDGGKSLHALCVDLASGKLLHDVEVFRHETVPAIHARNSYASPTPVLDGDRLYVHFGALGTACLSSKDGKKLWENTELKIEHQVGPGGSPTLYKDRLLIPCDGTDLQYEVALDKMTGKVLWKTDRSAIEKLKNKPEDMRKAYGTPLILEVGKQAQSLTTAAERLYALDPTTGRELWYVDYPGFSNVPAPVSDGSAAYVCTGFMKPELWAIKLGGATGNVTDSHVLWKQKAGAPDQSSPVLVGNRLYLVAGGGITSCIDTKDGRIVWKERLGGDYAASLLHANGHVFVFDSGGKSHVIKPGDTYKLVATNQLESGLMASPAVAGDALILRTKTHLYRIEE